MKTQQQSERTVSKPFLLTILIVSCAAIALSAFALVTVYSQPKIGVIKTDKLVYQYTGMKEAQNSYKEKHKAWLHEVDSLESEFKNAVQQYKIEEPALAASEKKKRQEQLGMMQQTLEQHKTNISEKAAQEDREMTEGVLNQVNSYIEEYGKEKGFDVILGTTSSGSILHAQGSIDVTDDVLQVLNKSYQITMK